MKHTILKTLAVASVAVSLGACSSYGTGLSSQQTNAALGAVAGGVVGNLIGGDTGATLGGAALGGVIGSQIGK